MKKLITLVLAAIFTLSVFVPVFAGQKVAIKDQDQIKLVVFKIGDSNYYVEDKDGNILTVPMDVAPYIKDGRTLVPARFLGNALGVPDEKITWNQATRTATLQGKKKLTLVIGSLNMKSDDEVVKMDVAPEIKSGRTMLLARYVAEGLGYEVGWDAVRKLVICWEEGTPQPDMSKILKEIETEVITMGKGNTRISIRNVEGFFDVMPNDRWGIHYGFMYELNDGSVSVEIPANPLIYTVEQSRTYINETVRAIKAQYGDSIGNKVAESLQKALVSARDTTGMVGYYMDDIPYPEKRVNFSISAGGSSPSIEIWIANMD